MKKRYRPRGMEGKRDRRGWLDPRKNHQGKRIDRTCQCTAYKFPHRQFAGLCRMVVYVQAVFDPFNKDCRTCMSFNEALRECQVSEGLEEAPHCGLLQEYIHTEGIVLHGAAKRMWDRAFPTKTKLRK